MMDFVTDPDAPDHVEYLDAAAGTVVGRGYKQRLFGALDVRMGHVVLDVGCGPGTDLGRLAEAVGATGSVIGIDHDAVMVEKARERMVAHRNVEVRTGDVHAVAVDDAGVDRARADRVLQHVADPAQAVTSRLDAVVVSEIRLDSAIPQRAAAGVGQPARSCRCASRMILPCQRTAASLPGHCLTPNS
jgi:SAM-dependent methyltransferase